MRYTPQAMSLRSVTCSILDILLANDIRRAQKAPSSHPPSHDLSSFTPTPQTFIPIPSPADTEDRQHDMEKELLREQIARLEAQTQGHSILQQHSDLGRQENELQTHRSMIESQYQRALEDQQTQHANNTMRALQEQKAQHERDAMLLLETQEREAMVEVESQKAEIAVLKEQLRRNEMEKVQGKRFYTITSVQTLTDCINAAQSTVPPAAPSAAVPPTASPSKLGSYAYPPSHRRQHSIIETTVTPATPVPRVEVHAGHSSQPEPAYASIGHYDTPETPEADNYRPSRDVHLPGAYGTKDFPSVTDRRHATEISRSSGGTSDAQPSKSHHQYRQQDVQRDYRQPDQLRDHPSPNGTLPSQRSAQPDSQNRRASHDDSIDPYLQQQDCIKLTQKIVARNKEIERLRAMVREDEQLLLQKQRSVLELMQRA